MTGGTDCTDGRIRGVRMRQRFREALRLQTHKTVGMTGPGRHRCISAHQGSGVALARPATPGRAGSGPREVCADYDAIGHVLLAVLCQVRSSS